ncbi:MAG: minor capsid protein [Schwartzia sp.]|nr:minor capsid protein [Schwartzia sp. (in: firmicutes)]
MTSEEYWQKRAEEREKYWHKKSAATIEKEMADQFEMAAEEIRKDISAFYSQFAEENELSYAEAKRILQGSKFRVWRMSIEEYIEQIEKAEGNGFLLELNTLAMRSRISPLDKLYGETLMALDRLGRKVDVGMRSFLTDAYKDNYYRGLFEIGKSGVALPGVNALKESDIDAVIRARWSGKNFSERIWNNTKELGKTVQRAMTNAAHRGSDMQAMTDEVARYLKGGHGYNSAVRLVRTELNYVENMAALDSIKDAGMRYYRFTATLDERTSDRCREYDGHIYAVEDASPGDNMPPLHPRCRSVISGSVKGEKDARPRKGTRAARDEAGENIRVPADMRYAYWYRKYVDTRGSKYGIIKADKEVSGHASAPKKSNPYDIVDHLDRNGKTDKRTFYDNTGKPYFEINVTDHNQPKRHKYGKHGEHAHDIQWTKDGKSVRSTRNLYDFERKDNGDIL